MPAQAGIQRRANLPDIVSPPSRGWQRSSALDRDQMRYFGWCISDIKAPYGFADFPICNRDTLMLAQGKRPAVPRHRMRDL